MPGPGTSADEPMNTPDFVCGISPGSIATAGRDTAVTARPVVTIATQIRAFAIELILLCLQRARRYYIPGLRRIFVTIRGKSILPTSHYLLRGWEGSLSIGRGIFGSGFRRH